MLWEGDDFDYLTFDVASGEIWQDECEAEFFSKMLQCGWYLGTKKKPLVFSYKSPAATYEYRVPPLGLAISQDWMGNARCTSSRSRRKLPTPVTARQQHPSWSPPRFLTKSTGIQVTNSSCFLVLQSSVIKKKGGVQNCCTFICKVSNQQPSNNPKMSAKITLYYSTISSNQNVSIQGFYSLIFYVVVCNCRRA